MRAAPIRFLLAVLLLWAGVRAAVLLPDWSGRLAPVPTATAAPVQVAGRAASPISAPAAPKPVPGHLATFSRQAAPEARPDVADPQPILLAAMAGSRERPPGLVPRSGGPSPPAGPQPSASPLSLPISASSSRWSVSAWLLLRDEGRGQALAPGGTLGGSQAGARVTFRLGGGFALSGRAYLPVRDAAAAEVAAGIDWRPVSAFPVNLLAERRQRLGRDGRSAFTLTLYGGASHTLTPRTRLDVYGQAGVVGIRSRDLFVDGSVRLARRVGPVELGAGAWGAAQPGSARLDAGPSLAWRLPVRDIDLRLQADWRFRLAGDAAPGSGPALTLATDF